MMDITFEDSLWEQELGALAPGGVFSAARFLALLEGEDQDTLEDAFVLLQSKGATLDLKTLPAFSLQGEAALRLRQEQQLAQKADMAASLEPTDPLRLYLEELAMLPAVGDETLMAQALLSGDKTAAEKLANLGLSRVIQLAKHYAGMGVLLLDLIQEGSMGLWQGILCYTGGDFAQHRDWWICHFMTRAVIFQAHSSGIGQKLRQGMEDYRDTDQRLLGELGRNPTLEEIAQAMHVTPEDAQVYGQTLQFAQTQAKIKQPAEPDPQEEEQAVEDTAYFQMRQRIAQLLSVLPERSAQLLTLRFGLEGAAPMTPEETGKQLSMTAEEVLAAEAAALSKLREEK